MDQLLSIQIHLSGASSDTFTLTTDHPLGANYDTVIASETLSSATDKVFVFGDGYEFPGELPLLFTSTHAADVTAYYTILYKEI